MKNNEPKIVIKDHFPEKGKTFEEIFLEYIKGKVEKTA